MALNPPHAKLVARVKRMQKRGFREHWSFYCSTYSNGTRDPAKYDHEFLVGFIRYATQCDGHGPTYVETLPLPTLEDEHILEVKTMQRLGYREVWIAYCQLFGSGSRDPSKQSPGFCSRFVRACQAGYIQEMLKQEWRARNYDRNDTYVPICEIEPEKVSPICEVEPETISPDERKNQSPRYINISL